MSYEITHLWLWLALAAVIGGALGWFTESREPQAPWFQGWVKTAVFVFALAFIAAVLHMFAGHTAYWIETAVLFFAAYVAGALVGGGLRRFQFI